MNWVKKTVRLFIDGRFEESLPGTTFASIDPATEETIAEIFEAAPVDVDRAVAAARRAFDDGPWPRMSPEERAAYLNAIADALEENTTTLTLLESMDTGLPITTCLGHVERAVDNFRFFAGEGLRLRGETLSIGNAYLSVTTREPVGVVAALTPWNGPLAIATLALAPALACGNTCVLKPSELTPVTIGEVARIVEALELPAGVVNIVNGRGITTGAALAAHPGVDAIAFTGSTPTGRLVLESAAKTLKRFVGELGGGATTLVFADVDLDETIDATFVAAFSNNGETCVAGSSIWVERCLHDSFVQRFVARTERLVMGDPREECTEIGPVICQAQLERLLLQVERAKRRGATILCGGARSTRFRQGYYLEPTVLREPSAVVLTGDEHMGPLVTIGAFDSEADAIRQANNGESGLGAYVWCGNTRRALRVAQSLRFGTVWVNAAMVRDIKVPFGGFRQSGVGRVGGRFSMESFTEVKNTCLAVQPLPAPQLAGSRTS